MRVLNMTDDAWFFDQHLDYPQVIKPSNSAFHVRHRHDGTHINGQFMNMIAFSCLINGEKTMVYGRYNYSLQLMFFFMVQKPTSGNIIEVIVDFPAMTGVRHDFEVTSQRSFLAIHRLVVCLGGSARKSQRKLQERLGFHSHV